MASSCDRLCEFKKELKKFHASNKEYRHRFRSSGWVRRVVPLGTTVSYQAEGKSYFYNRSTQKSREISVEEFSSIEKMKVVGVQDIVMRDLVMQCRLDTVGKYIEDAMKNEINPRQIRIDVETAYKHTFLDDDWWAWGLQSGDALPIERQ